MIRVAICDEAEPERRTTVEFCERYFEKWEEEYHLLEYESGERILEEDNIDILLLDTEMKNVSGILIKDLLWIMRANTRIIFVSGRMDRMSEAFGKNVFAFLKKPLDYDFFCEKMDGAVEDMMEERECIYCREIVDYENVYHKVCLRDVIYVEAQGRKTLIYTERGSRCVRSDIGISQWREEYKSQKFLSCHRSYVVNLFHVVRVGDDVELTAGLHVPLARERRKEFGYAVKKYKKMS